MNNGFLVKNRFQEIYLNCGEVLYFMKEMRKVFIYTDGKKLWEYGSIDDLMDRSDDRMFRCHYSLAVNLDQIRSFEQDCLTLANGITLGMCGKALRATKKAWKDRLSSRG